MLLNDPILYGATLPYGDVPIQSSLVAPLVPQFASPWQNMSRVLPQGGFTPYQQFQTPYEPVHAMQPWPLQQFPTQQFQAPQFPIQQFQAPQLHTPQLPTQQQFSSFTPWMNQTPIPQFPQQFTPQFVPPFNLNTSFYDWQRPFIC
jgi:hypothetical protein